MPYAYLLRCADGSFYAGSTWDLSRRIEQHAAGSVPGYTATRLPVELAWFTELDRIDDAYALEKRIQGWSRAKRLALIEGRLEALPGLSSRTRRRSTEGLRDASG